MGRLNASLTAVALAAAAALAAPSAIAAGGQVKEYKDIKWHFEGPFGRYDKDALQRGFQVYREVCANCHGMDLVSFRNLGQKGGPFYLESCPEGVAETIDCSNPNDNPIVKALAAEYTVMDGPDEYGDMFERAAIPADRLPNPYDNVQIARLANGGALPPDQSLIVKARPHGADYIYSLLVGYVEPPETIETPIGQYYNPYFPGDMSQYLNEEFVDEEGHPKKDVEVPYGGFLAMAQPLYDEMVDYADEETPETIEQYAKDVVEFLMWAAEPKLEARKKLGVITLGYLLIMTGILYWSYREVWSNVKTK
ncbi:MAG: cytochrome c1 [Pseudomonadota bacterium]